MTKFPVSKFIKFNVKLLAKPQFSSQYFATASRQSKMPVPEPQRLLNNLEDLVKKSPDLEKRLPMRPEEPLPQDCCGQSCKPCVFDIYQTELDDWVRRCWRRIQYPDQTDEEIAKDIPQEQSLFVLQPNTYHSLKLISITPTTHDTNIYRFSLPSPTQRLFIPIGNHIIMKGCYEPTSQTIKSGSPSSDDSCGTAVTKNGTPRQLLTVVRQYTPITEPEVIGYMDLMIKIYPHGKMSSYLRAVQKQFDSSQEVRAEFRGPYGLFTYEQNDHSDLLMLAAGTGLTPMAQIIEYILRNEEEDMTRIRLLLCCRRYDEILLKDRLDDWRRHWNFSVCYILSQWREETDRQKVKYGEDIVTGTRLDQHRVTDEVKRLQQLDKTREQNDNVSTSSSGYKVLICGTKTFEKDMMNYLLKSGVVAKRIFRF